MASASSDIQMTDSSSPDVNRKILTAAKGGGIIFVGGLFTFFSRFVTGILMARLLGVEQYGLYSITFSASSIAVGLAMLGMDSALVRYVSLFNRRRDTDSLWGVLQLAIASSIAMGMIMAIGLHILAVPIAEQLFNEPKVAPLLRLASVAIPFSTLGNIAAAATQGFNRMKYTTIALNFVQPLIKLGLILLLAIGGLDAVQALVAHTVALIVGALMMVYFLNNLFSLRHPLRQARWNIREVFNFSLPVYLARLIVVFRGNIQTVLLGALHTIAGTGVFTAASQFNFVGLMFHDAVATSSKPIISELYDQEAWKQMERLYQAMTRWTFALNFPLFLIALLFPKQILSILGQGFVGGATALIILAGGNLTRAITGISGAVLDMTGKTRLKLVNVIIVSVLTVILNIVLIPRYGVLGAAMAAALTITVGSLIAMLEVFVLFRLIPYSKEFLKPAIAGFMALLFVFAMSRFLPPGMSLAYVFLHITILLTVYGGIILILGLSEEDLVVLARLRMRVEHIVSGDGS